MSYCRWSSDDFQCDLYVYEGVDGVFYTHVATNRVIYTEPLPPPIPFKPEFVQEYSERHKKVMAMVDAADREPIGLQHDGHDFCDDDSAACADRLEYLKGVGYRVPQYAIDALREEAAEGSE
ncbi:TPA: hypothetical protein SL368_005881 [Pseudomonas aeruginosa]|nr:hypothetical protein [Pseudomonas aeruginosa]HEJ3333285.1 hypothetical protein [Pseudomonas aeruginosa]HEJ5001395.1 hypothetical protein [Pseudomonas aeruginosa]HEJ5061563.1 hypothetical protein [Pseudomonas aeruginosa]HEJ6441835.1 hypothetical protein [Pseudomonas aeruginosa]